MENPIFKWLNTHLPTCSPFLSNYISWCLIIYLTSSVCLFVCLCLSVCLSAGWVWIKACIPCYGVLGKIYRCFIAFFYKALGFLRSTIPRSLLLRFLIYPIGGIYFYYFLSNAPPHRIYILGNILSFRLGRS